MATLKLTKKYKRYPKYKDSGVAWVGEIPEGWEMRKLFHLFTTVGSGTTPEEGFLTDLEDGIPWVNTGDLNDMNMQLPTKKVKREALHKYSALRLFSQKSVVIAMYGATIGKLGIPQFEFCTNQACCVLEKAKNFVSEKYIYYWLLGNKKYIIDLGYGGGQPNINKDIVKSLKISLPDIELQQKIATYLDEKTALIDAIIEKKKKQIELLREKRSALINRAVMNARGAKIRLRYHVNINPSKQELSYIHNDAQVAFLPMEAVSETGVVIPQKRMYKDIKDGFTYFQNEDVVLAKITPCYENGKAAIIRNLEGGFGFGTTEFIVLRPDKSILPQYLYFVVYSDNFRKHGEIEMRGSAGQKRVSDKFVRNYQIQLPNLQIQEAIISKLQSKLTLIDRARIDIEKSITLLQEFKSALISNVVTGKIKI